MELTESLSWYVGGTELPRLIPLVVEALREYEKETVHQQDISKQILIVEDSPGLTFGPNPQRTLYPVIFVIKNNPFTASELALIKERVNKSDAKVIAIPGGYVQPPYDRLLSGSGNNSNNIDQRQRYQEIEQLSYDPQRLGFELKPPTDDSPFFFATQLSSKSNGIANRNSAWSICGTWLIVGLLCKGKQD